MNTQELRHRMIDDLAQIGYDITKREASVNDRGLLSARDYIFFDDIESGHWEGSYYFEKDGLYYDGYIERGNKECPDGSSNLHDFLFPIYSSIASNIAQSFVWNSVFRDIAEHRVLDVKRLALLKIIDESYYKKGLEKIRAIMNDNMNLYDDGLGLSLDLSLLDRVRVKSDEELTSELREQVVSDIGLMGYDITRDEGKTLFFGDVEQGDKDGVYLFARLEPLYRNTTYKGVIRQGERYMSDMDYSGNILRELYSSIAFDLARQYIETVHLGSLSKRRVLRIKQCELLKRIASYYCDMARLETRNEMRKHPELYNDNRGDNLDPSLLEHLTSKKHH